LNLRQQFLGTARDETSRLPGNRFQQPSAVTHSNDANILQVVSGKLGQNMPVDVIFGKRRRVLPETQASQPFGSVHRTPETLVTLTKSLRGSGD
jgi:hypothetical protein